MALQRDTEIGFAVTIDITGDDGVAAAVGLAQLSLRAAKVVDADESKIVVAGIACASLGVDRAELDVVTDARTTLREIGDQVARRRLGAAVGETCETEKVSVSAPSKNVTAAAAQEIVVI